MLFYVDGKKIRVHVRVWDARKETWDHEDIVDTIDDDITASFDGDPYSDSYGCYVVSRERYEEFRDWWQKGIDAYNNQEPSWLYADEDPHCDYCVEMHDNYPEYYYMEDVES